MIQPTDRQMHYGRVAGAPHGSAARAALWLLACGLCGLGGVAQGQPTDLTLTNATITSGSTSYAATNSITAGSPSSPFTVGGSASVSFTAGSRIVLNPGFQATAGSAPVTFQASIGVVAPPPDFTVTLTPASQTVTAGGSATYTVTVTALNGFNGPVSLSWPSGLPYLATYTLSPTTVTGSGAAQLTVTTNSSAAAGTYSFTVTGTSGTLTHTSNSVGLTVNAAAAPSIGITVTATSPTTVTSGGSATYAVSVTALNGFSGIVGFQVAGFPAGAMYNFSPWTVAITQGSTATTMMTVTTPAGGAAGGPYSLVVTAAGGGVTANGWGTLSVSAPAPDFTVSVGTGGTAPGSSALYALQVTPLNGFTGAVGLSVGGLPAGVTASFSQNNLSGGWPSQLTVNVPSGTPAGSYTFTITGVSGGLSHVWNVALPVSLSSPSTVAASQTGFSFSVDGAAYAAAQTFTWQTGGTHTLSAPGSQTDASGNSYVFSGWSDGGDMTHSVTANPAVQSYAVTYSPAGATKVITALDGIYSAINNGVKTGWLKYCITTTPGACAGNLDAQQVKNCTASGTNVTVGDFIPHVDGTDPSLISHFSVTFQASEGAEDGARDLNCSYNGSPVSLVGALTVYDATPVITGISMGQPDANGFSSLTISGHHFGSWRGSVVFSPYYEIGVGDCSTNIHQALVLAYGGGYTVWNESQVVVSAYTCPGAWGQSGLAVISAGTNTSGHAGTFLAKPGSTQPTSNQYPVLIGSPPTISSMVPDQPIYAGGQGAWVTLYGSNFGASTGSIQVCTNSSGNCISAGGFSVSLSGQYSYWGPGQINFVLSAPSNSAGVTFYLQVTYAGGSFQGGRWGFTPTAQPTVTVSPQSVTLALTPQQPTPQQQFTASGTPAGGTYSWSAGAGLTLQNVSGGQATAQAVSTGTSSVTVTYTTAGGGTATGSATVNVVTPKLVSVLWGGNKQAMVKVNADWATDNLGCPGYYMVNSVQACLGYGSTAETAAIGTPNSPEWQDPNGSGSPTVTDPVAYVMGNTPAIQGAQINISSNQSLTAMVRVDVCYYANINNCVVYPNLSFNPATVSFSSGIGTAQLTSTSALPSNIINGSLLLTWSMSFDNGSTYTQFAQVKQTVFTIFAHSLTASTDFWVNKLPAPWPSELIAVTAARLNYATGLLSNDCPQATIGCRSGDQAIVDEVVNSIAEFPDGNLESNYSNEDLVGNYWRMLDDGIASDCISLAGLAGLVLAQVGIRADSHFAYPTGVQPQISGDKGKTDAVNWTPDKTVAELQPDQTYKNALLKFVYLTDNNCENYGEGFLLATVSTGGEATQMAWMAYPKVADMLPVPEAGVADSVTFFRSNVTWADEETYNNRLFYRVLSKVLSMMVSSKNPLDGQQAWVYTNPLDPYNPPQPNAPPPPICGNPLPKILEQVPLPVQVVN